MNREFGVCFSSELFHDACVYGACNCESTTEKHIQLYFDT